MGLLSFIKDAGEKLFGGSSAHAATPGTADAPDANAAAAAAIKTYIDTQNLGLTGLVVTYAAAAAWSPSRATRPRRRPAKRQRWRRATWPT
jgi:hypothetical protein